MGGISGVYKSDLTTSVFSFVGEILPKCRPTAVENALAQGVVANHIAHPQVFQCDLVEVGHQRRAQFVQVVGALLGDMHLVALDVLECFSTVVTAWLGTGKLALQDAEPLLSGAVVGGMGDLLPVAGGEEGRETDINSHYLPGGGQRVWLLNLAREAGIPLTRFVADANGPDCPFEGSMPTHAHPPNAEQFEPPSVQPRPHAELFEQKAVVVIAPFETGVARSFPRFHPAEEGLKGQVDLFNDTLRRLAKDLIRIREGLAVVLPQLVQLRLVHTVPFHLVGNFAFSQGHVV